MWKLNFTFINYSLYIILINQSNKLKKNYQLPTTYNIHFHNVMFINQTSSFNKHHHSSQQCHIWWLTKQKSPTWNNHHHSTHSCNVNQTRSPTLLVNMLYSFFRLPTLLMNMLCSFSSDYYHRQLKISH